MINTPRLDSLTANGPTACFERIRLADGQALTLKIRAGADTVDEVLLHAGLTALDVAAWTGRGQSEVWLSDGHHSAGTLYLDVPIEVVRDLVVQHGGEHEDQESGEPSLEQLRSPDLLADIADLYGRFKDGYTPDDIRTVFARIYDAGGPYLVCVWDYADEYGFGGNSQFYAEREDGGFFEVQPDIHQWLSGQKETPGPVSTWVCAPVAEPEFAASDDFHNYARTDRTE